MPRPPAVVHPPPFRSPTAGTCWSTPLRPSGPSSRVTRRRSRRLRDIGFLSGSSHPCPSKRRRCRNGARTAVSASTTSCIFRHRACRSCRSRTGPDWPATPCAATCAPVRSSRIDERRDRACSTTIVALPKYVGRRGSEAASRSVRNSRLGASRAATTSFDAASRDNERAGRVARQSGW